MPVIDTTLQKESRDRYLTYALSVVSGRALPDVRDGLKPVQRRILFAMLNNLNLTPDKSFRKSAAVVGEVLARFHPHGDIACYEAMVRMAQDFSLRYPLVEGQGNFGSLDGDGAAAYRYTEAKLRPLALEVIGEIFEETVEFRDNFDGTVVEPIVFPSRVPNFLINGASGIAVGMATSIPPHNLRDTVKALIELIDEPEISEAKLATAIKGPDFPTGCQILNTKRELTDIYKTGRGAIRMRGEWKIEEGNRGKRYIVVTSIPYAVNKSDLVEKIASAIIDKKLPQLSDVRDESTSEVRIVLELSANADPEAAIAFLFKNTPLESNFPVNLTALVPVSDRACKPELLSLKACLTHFVRFRREVTRKKLVFERKKLLERIHILEGLIAIFDDLDVAIKIVRKSEGRSDAASKLQAHFKLSEIQAYAVVDMRIYQLSKTNIEEVRAEMEEKSRRVKEIDSILKSEAKITAIVRKDLEQIAETYGDKRRSQLVRDEVEIEYNEEAYVVHEDVYAIVTRDGWVKRIRQNNELGTTRLREGDAILRAFPLSTVDSMAFFTSIGQLYSLRVADFPASGGYGEPIQKILKFRDGERIVESFAIKSAPEAQLSLADGSPPALKGALLKDGDKIAMLSERGMGFSWVVSELLGLKRNGKRVMKVRDGDALSAVCHLKKKLAMFTGAGSALVIEGSELQLKEGPVVGLTLMGVRDDDKLVAALSYNGEIKLAVTVGSGKVKEVETKELTHGHRALKGTKVFPRDDITSVDEA